LKFRQLRYFVKIVEVGSISRAAAIVHIAQPALSKHMVELEDELGLSLLHRTSRGVTPTADGEVLYEEALKLIRQIEELPAVIRSRQGVIEGVVCFGLSSSMAPAMTGKLVELCKAALPQVTLRFVIADSHSLREKALAQTVDLAMVFEDKPETGFKREVLFRQRLYLLSRKQDNPKKSVTLADICQLPLMLPSPHNVLRQALDSKLKEVGLSVSPIAESDLFDVHLSAVEGGVGYTILPKGSFSEVAGHRDIATVPIEPPIYLTACLISARDKPLTRAAVAVEAQLKSLIRNRLSEPNFEGAESMENADSA
jgi:LysR family transcriptional regulator, nitrogen assimilation regulatory protein